MLTLADGVPTWADAQGGLLPQAVVTTEPGASVTATLGGTIVGPVVADEGGFAVLDMPSYGTWTLSAELDGETASDTLAVIAVEQYSVDLPIISVADGLIAYWDFSEQSVDGNSIADLSGNGHTLTASNISYAAGITSKGRALVFNGTTSSRAYMTDDILPRSAPETICAWFYQPSYKSMGLIAVGAYGGNTPYRNNVLYLQAERSGYSGNGIIFGIRNDSDSTYHFAAKPADLPSTFIDNWHFAVGIWANSKLSVYVDSVLIGQVDVPAAFTLGSPWGMADKWGFNFAIGATDDYAPNGRVAEVRLYSRALTSEEITTLYNERIAS